MRTCIALLMLSTATAWAQQPVPFAHGDAKAGEAYFQAHCANCHSPTGDLAHVAKKYEPVALQSRFLYPQNSNRFGEGPPPDPG